MGVLKCKMCGGSLVVTDNSSIAECEYCGTQQTLPKMDDEKRLGLYNRASHLRQQCAFDKAEQIFEKIVTETPDDAEAHWSLVLCRYGIEYVEDPATFERIPTCHRASYDSILEDIDYIEAINNADPIAVSLYKKEAARIDRIQKGILEISRKEKPFDIFICYKETDSIGNRTIDSVKAQEIYDALTSKGYNVFFSRITLEDKLGQAYEPYIFAALNSAKIMLVIGTDPDYVNAVWVKNEWSRFLKIMRTLKNRTLIPCYMNISPYELPAEFSYLQAQDMGKLGFIQDLLRGISKILPKGSVAPVSSNIQTNQNAAAAAALLDRVEVFLEDGDFERADEYCEKVLDLDVRNGRAYLGKLLVELRLHRREDLANVATPFDASKNFHKLMTYGSEELKAEINCYSENIRNAIVYREAMELFTKADTLKDWQELEQKLHAISTYKDVPQLIEKCQDEIGKIKSRNERSYVQAQELMHQKKYYQAISLFASIVNYKDSFEMAKKCVDIHNERIAKSRQKQAEYNSQLKELKNDCQELKKNLRNLQSRISRYYADKERLGELRSQKASAENQQRLLESELAGLGFFSRGRRQEIQNRINMIIQDQKQLDDEIQKIESYTEESVRQDELEIKKTEEEDARARSAIAELQQIIHEYDNNTVPVSLDSDYGYISGTLLILSADGFTRPQIDEKIKNNLIKQIIVSEGVTVIPAGAFRDCTSVISVTLPESLTEIEDYAFAGCTSLKNIRIPSSVTTIGKFALKDCTTLECINVPTGVRILEDFCFQGCKSVSNISLPDTVTEIGIGILCGCTSLSEAVLPGNIKSIPNGMFLECLSLTNITIPESVISIGSEAFTKCFKLTKVNLPSSVTSIGKKAFQQCKALKEMTIPDGVTVIADNTFDRCESLKSVSLPSSLTEIEEHAFFDCSKLSNIRIPESVTKICEGAFYSCNSIPVLTLPDGITEIADWTFYCCQAVESLKIPEGVSKIGRNAFYHCTALKSVIIPDSVQEIGYRSFEGCSSLENIRIPRKTKLGEFAFDGTPVQKKIQT